VLKLYNDLQQTNMIFFNQQNKILSKIKYFENKEILLKTKHFMLNSFYVCEEQIEVDKFL
jgi:hypothetical protein